MTNDHSASDEPASNAGSESGVRTVVLVGHCGPDMFMLKSALGRAVPGAAIETVNDAKTLAAHLQADRVLLVNRILDGRFATTSGIELIEQIAAGADTPVMILISNLEDAQRQAEAAGAAPGFGKSQLYDSRTLELLGAAARID